jgi:hypothetical protein
VKAGTAWVTVHVPIVAHGERTPEPSNTFAMT